MKNVHVIPHSHWDREWYMPFDYHRAYLVKLIDECMNLFENDKAYKAFHLDGHTALVEDYLEIKPQNEQKIKEYIKNERFAVGPWYILQDEFLTSAEANIRNLLVGMDLARTLGKVTKVGYFPDSFGNAGQMPQILSQAGMKAILFGRGVKSVGMDNAVIEDEAYASKYSEIYWASPDGTCLPSVTLPNWYCNGMEIPKDADRDYWDTTLKNVEKFASTDELLLLNGCDHQPVQIDLSEALANAREKYPAYNFIHSDMESYMDAVIKNLPADVTTITGELISQDTNGWFTLVNTCSAHVDLKVMNRKCEMLLEGVAEPLSVMTREMGKEYPHDMLLYSWKTLMKNHPHDSICACSCDAVAEEMRTRFKKAQYSAEVIIHDNLEYIKQHTDISKFSDCDAVFMVVNTMSKGRCGLISTDVDLKRVYKPQNAPQTFKELNDTIYKGAYELVDEDGNRYACEVANQRAQFDYDLPKRSFRQRYIAQRVTVSFEAEDVPALSCKLYGLRKTSKAESTAVANNTLENKYLKAVIQADGTIDLLDKTTNKVFQGLMRFEDTGDIGSEYTYVPANAEPILSGNRNAEIELIRQNDFVTEYKVTVTMNIPKSQDSSADEERNTYVALCDRVGGRSDESVALNITSYLTLTKNSRRLDVKTVVDNNARDHRLRVLFPTGLNATAHKAETIFEAPVRNNAHKETWTYPSGCEHQQGFVCMSDEEAGIAVANIGLYEYETMGNTIAVTLLRAVGEMGDWGVFPTELSQVQKTLELEYSIMPYGDEADIYTDLSAFQYPMLTTQIFESNENKLNKETLVWSGDYLKAFAFKNKMNGKDIIMRWANYSNDEQILTIKKTKVIDNLYRSNVIEEKGEMLFEEGGEWKISVKPYEIITVGVVK
ncbi:MAG: alpha-mannosidase [Ruminococcaceae bacterium]|nr:alpha-mannosidase [Oscillospiraceae bacterium]